jgi:hypothetical protein
MWEDKALVLSESRAKGEVDSKEREAENNMTLDKEILEDEVI